MAMKARMKGGPRHTITSLNVMVKATERGLWPTPRAVEWKANDYQQKGEHAWLTLTGAARLWPTPTAITNTGGAAFCKWGGSRSRAKLREMLTAKELNGALNPTWVEWLMGYPLGWTVCEDWETRLSRRSRNGSGSKS